TPRARPPHNLQSFPTRRSSDLSDRVSRVNANDEESALRSKRHRSGDVCCDCAVAGAGGARSLLDSGAAGYESGPDDRFKRGIKSSGSLRSGATSANYVPLDHVLSRQRESRARASHRGFLERNRSAVNLGEIANDRQTEAGALPRFVRPNASPHDGLAHRRLYSRTVVINRNHDLFAFLRAGEPDPGAGPLAGVVEQVAEHLVEIFSLSPEGRRRGRIDLDAEVSFGMQPLERADKPLGGCGNRCARSRRSSRCGGSRVRQVIVDLPPHAIDLLIDLRGKLLVSRRPRP